MATSLFDNAVGSIRVGIEDFASEGDHRHVSAVRNLYAGILLLGKEVIARKFPGVDPDLLIAGALKPVVDSKGQFGVAPASSTTVDFDTLGRRFRDLGIAFDTAQLAPLKEVRRDLEHKFSAKSREAISEILAMALPVVRDLFALANEDPAKRLGDEWDVMLANRAVYDAELAACRQSLAAITWRSGTVAGADLVCDLCESRLVRQADGRNTNQELARLSCRACRNDLETPFVIEKTLEDCLGLEAYERVKDTGESGPVFSCPECTWAAFIDFEEACAWCGYALDGPSECAVCHTSLSIEERMEDPGRSLCSYHQHVYDRDD